MVISPDGHFSPLVGIDDISLSQRYEYNYGGLSALCMSAFGIYDTGRASMPDVGASKGCGGSRPSGLDAAVFEGRPYNLWTQIAPSDKYTLSHYFKKAPKK
ncbi:hypothetical protein AHAS_Ahas15G0269000 [Arachis hypogaea]